MGLFEFFGEKYNPGPVGGVNFNGGHKPPQRKYILLKFLAALLAVTAIEYFFFDLFYSFGYKILLLIHAIFFGYLFASYKVNIKPNYQNTGFVPFIIDHPFRYSDDINRFSIFMKGILWPGKFITTSFVDFYQLKNKKIDF